jgi:hypothetical protein
MSRAPTPAETAVLTALANKIQAIVQAATQVRLTATGLLADPPVTPHDYADFEQRFQVVYQNLQALIAAGRVRVNPDLSASMEANTPIGYVSGQQVASIEVNGTFLDGDVPSAVTDRAITLLHELTHTISEPPVFPVKDFAYRASWAFGYLPGTVGWRNADTYAEAAAQIAEGLENLPGRYREIGRIAAQRQVLRHLAAPLALGAALAWADVTINRAWLRSCDFSSHAQTQVGSRVWPDTLAAWRQPGQDSATLVAIEDDLRGRGVIGDRTGWITVDLDAASRRTAANIEAYQASLKDALGSARPVLSDAGAAITYTAATKVLDIPRAQAAGPVDVLGNRIVTALVTALSYTEAQDPSTARLNADKQAILDLLSVSDRAYEHQHVQAIQQRLLAGAPAGLPAQADWNAAKVAIDLAHVQGYAQRLVRIAMRATEAQAAAAGTPKTVSMITSLAALIQPDLAEAVQAGVRLRATAAANAPRIAAFVGMAQGLATLHQLIAILVPAQHADYTALITSVQPLTQ